MAACRRIMPGARHRAGASRGAADRGPYARRRAERHLCRMLSRSRARPALGRLYHQPRTDPRRHHRGAAGARLRPRARLGQGQQIPARPVIATISELGFSMEIYYLRVLRWGDVVGEEFWRFTEDEAYQINVTSGSGLARFRREPGEEIRTTLDKIVPGGEWYELSNKPGQYFPRMA